MKLKKQFSVLAALAGLLIAQISWATCDITSSFTSGQVLTAAQLNTMVTDSESCTNNVLNGDTLTGSLVLHSGSDLNVYSDTGSTLKASIDGATGAAILGLTQEGQMTNCGVTVSGTTLTIAGYDGTALSATNPCVVAIRSSTAGNLALAYFTANITTTFGATSDTDGNVMGITSTVSWASTMPMFLGVVNGAVAPFWTISRLPYVQTGAAATALAQEGDTDADAQLDMVALTTGLTLANEVNKPVTQVGWFDATYAATGEAWTFAVTGKNGFNRNYESVAFTMPAGQNGAITQGGTATHLYVAGGDGTTDVPTWATNQGVHLYWVHQDGTYNEMYATGASGNCTNGDVADKILLVSPFSAPSTVTGTMITGSAQATYGAAAVTSGPVAGTASTYTIQPYDATSGVTLTEINANAFSNTADDINITFTRQAF